MMYSTSSQPVNISTMAYRDPSFTFGPLMGTLGVSKPRKKIYKDGPYPELEPSLAADPNVFQLIAKVIGEWFNGKSKTKNTVKSVEGVTKEAPRKDESLTASKQSRASYSGLSGEGH